MILFIRHGATAGNLHGQYIGVTDEDLCPQGARTLRARAAKYPHVDTLYVSPMRRCRDTAAIIYPEMEQHIMPGLRECDFGDFEGKTNAELENDPIYKHWLETKAETPFPGGEGREAFIVRCVAAFSQAIREADGNDIAFVVHGGTIMAIISSFGGGDFYDWQTPNGGAIQAEFDGEKLIDIHTL